MAKTTKKPETNGPQPGVGAGAVKWETPWRGVLETATHRIVVEQYLSRWWAKSYRVTRSGSVFLGTGVGDDPVEALFAAPI